MASKVIGQIRKWPPGWRVLLSVIIALGTGLVLMRTVQAVHDLAFELDGNIVNDLGTPNGTFDWADFFNAAGQPSPVLPDPINRPGFQASSFVRDFVTNPNGTYSGSDDTTFTQGSKDTLPISTDWVCAHASNVGDKVDLVNAYALAYTAPDGDQIIYFGLERFSNDGDANVSFWFLQDQVGCSAAQGTQSFVGDHRDGDLLIVSAFTNGGTVSTIDVYRWDIDAAHPFPGALRTTPVAHGVDCRTTGANDDVCATSNIAAQSPISVPWLTAFKSGGAVTPGHSLQTSEFFEGGLNLTNTGLGGHCFNVFLADTRQSQSLTAALSDFALGQLGECTSTVVTTPSIGPAGQEIPPNATILVTDSALVTVTGVNSFTGTLNFFLCGPFDAVSTTLCDTGGVPAGSQSITANGTYVSSTMTVTSAGRYCWRADFSASDPPGIPPSSDSRATECFVVSPRPTNLATQAGAPTVDFGNPVTDTATLINTANRPGSGGPAGSTDGSINPATPGGPATGTIIFTLYKNDCTTLATGTGLNPQSVAVLGDGPYGPVSFTPDAPGTYHWRASYSGDLPNTLGSTHNTLCNDPNEAVVVRQIPTEIKTKQSWIPNDTATVSATTGNLAAGGTVAFSLYNNPTCQGSALFSQTVSVPGGAPSAEVGTTNTTPITTDYTDPAGSAKAFSWKVVFTPDPSDTAHTGKQSACGAENFSITYTNDPGPGTALP